MVTAKWVRDNFTVQSPYVLHINSEWAGKQYPLPYNKIRGLNWVKLMYRIEGPLLRYPIKYSTMKNPECYYIPPSYSSFCKAHNNPEYVPINIQPNIDDIKAYYLKGCKNMEVVGGNCYANINDTLTLYYNSYKGLLQIYNNSIEYYIVFSKTGLD